MKYLLLTICSFSLLASCKDCLECKYATTKGSNIETFCSSTKSDREAFMAEQDSLASALGSQAICTKQGY